jgi:hypothetical protein
MGKLLIQIIILLAVFYFFILRTKSDPEAERRKKLAALAKKLQLEFNSNTDFKLAEKFSLLTWLQRGDVRYAYDVFRGYSSGYPVTIFDYHFSTPGGKRDLDYYWSAYVLEMKTHFPDMLINHESFESHIGELIGGPHISFESAEFSRHFRVRSGDKKFAFDVCNPRMMEYLLANKDLTIQINGTGLAVFFEDWLRPEKVEHNLSRLIEIRKLLPDYLFEKSKS